jgi:hypothetical protein
MKVIVIGSGMASLGAIKALIERGVKPIVLDIGLIPAQNTSRQKKELRESVLKRRKDPELQWSNEKGGFSNVWGASVLCPPASEFINWDKDAIPTSFHYKKCSEGIYYTAAEDGLSSLFKHPHSKLKVPPEDESAEYLLNKFNKIKKNKKLSWCIGRARQFIDYESNSIYSTRIEIENMEKNKKIIYMPGSFVKNITEQKDKVFVEYVSNGREFTLEGTSLFIGAGAVNTTKLLAKLCKLYETKLQLKYVDSTVLPFFTFKNISYNKNETLSNIFFELKDSEKSNTYSHIQISRPNEIIFNLLKYKYLPILLKRFVNYGLGYLYTALISNHSEICGSYEVTLKKIKNTDDFVIKNFPKSVNQKRILKNLSKILNSIGAFNLPLVSKNFDTHYYIGGSFPMTKTPKKVTDTDIFGSPQGIKRIHAIDSSIFPSIPSSTIGLLAMANAYRIAKLSKL